MFEVLGTLESVCCFWLIQRRSYEVGRCNVPVDSEEHWGYEEFNQPVKMFFSKVTFVHLTITQTQTHTHTRAHTYRGISGWPFFCRVSDGVTGCNVTLSIPLSNDPTWHKSGWGDVFIFRLIRRDTVTWDFIFFPICATWSTKYCFFVVFNLSHREDALCWGVILCMPTSTRYLFTCHSHSFFFTIRASLTDKPVFSANSPSSRRYISTFLHRSAELSDG